MTPETKRQLLDYARARIDAAVARLRPQGGGRLNVQGHLVSLRGAPSQATDETPRRRPARFIDSYALEPAYPASADDAGAWPYYEGQPFHVHFPPIMGVIPQLNGRDIYRSEPPPELRVTSAKPYIVATVVYDLASRPYTVGPDTFDFGGAATLVEITIDAHASMPAAVAPDPAGFPVGGPPWDYQYRTPGRYEEPYLIAQLIAGRVNIQPLNVGGLNGWGGWHYTEDAGFYNPSGTTSYPLAIASLSVP